MHFSQNDYSLETNYIHCIGQLFVFSGNPQSDCGSEPDIPSLQGSCFLLGYLAAPTPLKKQLDMKITIHYGVLLLETGF